MLLGTITARTPLPLQSKTMLLPLFFFKFLFIYLFIFGCIGSSFLCEGFL